MNKSQTTVMVGADGSDNSVKAVKAAAELAERFDIERILAIHVIAPSVIPDGGESAGMHLQVVKAMEDRADQIVQSTEKHLAEADLDCVVETEILHGDPGLELVEKATEEQVDYVVVGSRGNTGMARFLLGSVSERVVRNAPCSVMVVR